MANQIIIDIGAVANDGTGDPLRTAFGYVNDNFSNIWTTGVANSNISFSGNKILTTNTNGNLVLAPNGIGKVQSNVDIVPNANNTLSLGSLTNKWNTVYAQNLDVGGNVEFNDLTVDGNLTVTGNIIQIGNIVTDSKTIQLANTAGTDAAANGSGITVGASDDVATLLYNSTGDVWTTNIGLTATGNISGTYFVGNGSLLTGIASYGNANVAAYLPTYTGNLSGGNLTVSSGANTWTIAGQTLTTPGGAFWYSNPDQSTDDLVSAPGSDIRIRSIDTDSVLESQLNLTPVDVEIVVVNGVTRTWRFNESGITEFPGCLTPVVSVGGCANIGNVSNPWANAYFSGNVTTTGNVSANYFVGNGSQLTGVASTGNITFTDTTMSPPDGEDIIISAANSEVDIQALDFRVETTDDVRITGNGLFSLRNLSTTEPISIFTDSNGSEYEWEFNADGTLTTPSDITVGGDVTGTVGASTLVLRAQPASNTSIQLNDSVDSVISTVANLEIRTDVSNTAKTWEFDTTGTLTAPGNISATGNISGGNLITTGNLVFSSTQVQSSAYAGGNGHAMMIDTNRTDTYVANGSADKPFKTFAAAIAAVATLNPTGTVPYTFILMGCTINEDVDFTPYNFNFITISTTCRSIFNNPVTFGNSALKQLTVRNVEFADTFTVTGDGTANQLNNTSFYNTSFTGAVTVTAANALAFYEAAFFSTVAFNNVNYVYVNGAQFNDDWTIRADNSGAYPVPANGITPGQIIALDLIANDINFVKGGTGTYVFQPEGARIGRTTEAYTLPAGWTVSAYISVFRGTWTNNGTWAMRNSSNDNAIAGTAPTYSGTIGGAIATVSGNITGGNIITAGNVSGNTAGYAIGYRDIPQVSFTGNATIATTDAGKHFYSTQSSNFTLTIANNASQSFQVGAAITVVNQGTGTITIAQGSGVILYLAGNATAGNRSVSTFGMATIMKVATDTWFINGTGVS